MTTTAIDTLITSLKAEMLGLVDGAEPTAAISQGRTDFERATQQLRNAMSSIVFERSRQQTIANARAKAAADKAERERKAKLDAEAKRIADAVKAENTRLETLEQARSLGVFDPPKNKAKHQ